MTTSTTQFVLPSDYTFTPGGLVVHKDTLQRLEKLLQQTEDRDPDAHNMYIYNDSEVDDGERVIATERAYGALLVTTLRGLESAEPSLLNEDTIPNLERALRLASAWADAQEGSCKVYYGKVVRGYGKKLFGARTPEERKARTEAETEAYKEFVRNLSAEERKRRGDRDPEDIGKKTVDDNEDDEDEEEDEEDGSKPWFGKAKAIDSEYNHASFKVTPTWKAYKQAWSASPHLPMRGPRTWDLTKWSAADKKQFSFDEMGGSDDDF